MNVLVFYNYVFFSSEIVPLDIKKWILYNYILWYTSKIDILVKLMRYIA